MDTQKIRDIEAFDLRERILKDICRTAETVEVRNRDRIRRKYGTGTKEAAEAWHNCRMSAAVMLVDRWGIRFEKEICKALKVDPAELNDYLSDEEVAACVDLEGRETAEAAGDLEGEGQQDDKTGAADAGSNAEILRRLTELEDRIISLQQITGVWGMDRADRDALVEGNIPDIAALCDVAADNVAQTHKRLDELEDSIHAIGTQVEAIWLHTGAVMLDDEGQAEK